MMPQRLCLFCQARWGTEAEDRSHQEVTGGYNVENVLVWGKGNGAHLNAKYCVFRQ